MHTRHKLYPAFKREMRQVIEDIRGVHGDPTDLTWVIADVGSGKHPWNSVVRERMNRAIEKNPQFESRIKDICVSYFGRS